VVRVRGGLVRALGDGLRESLRDGRDGQNLSGVGIAARE